MSCGSVPSKTTSNFFLTSSLLVPDREPTKFFIRGATTEQSILSVSTVQGTSPAVALYLDEQPVFFWRT